MSVGGLYSSDQQIYDNPKNSILGEDTFQKLQATNKFPGRTYNNFRSILFDDYILLQPIIQKKYYSDPTDREKIYVFNLKTLAWSTARNFVPSDLIGHSVGYSVTLFQNKLIAVGHYTVQARERAMGLFMMPGEQPEARSGSTLDTYHIKKLEGGEVEVLKSDRVTFSPLFGKSYHTADIRGTSLILFGGKDIKNQPNNDLTIFDLEDCKASEVPEKYTKQTNLPCPRVKHKSVILGEKLFIYGGLDSRDIILNDIWVLNLESFEWREISIEDTPCLPRIMPSSVAIKDKIIFFDQELFAYEPKNDSWESIIPEDRLPHLTNVHTLEVYQNKILFGSNANLYTLEIDFDVHEAKEVKIESQAKPSSLMSGLRKYYEEKPFANITFKVEGKEIPAHSFIAVRCSYFNKAFGSERTESTNKVFEISDMKAATFEALLEFLYCDELNATFDIAKDLIRISKEYMLPELKSDCEKILSEQIKVENVVELVKLAEAFEAKELARHGLTFIADNLLTVIENNDIRQLSNASLFQIYQIKPKK